MVRYSCSQPPDLIPRPLDGELEEVPTNPNSMTEIRFFFLQVSITLEGLSVNDPHKETLPDHIEQMVQTALKDMN